MPAMGRRRTKNHDLPPQMQRKGGRYYYGRDGIALGADFPTALRAYAELHVGVAPTGTFAEAATLYTRNELKARAVKTQREYERQLAMLVRVFGTMGLDTIRPVHVAEFMAARPKIAATREKALLSLVFNYARKRGLTDATNPCAGIRGVKSHRDRYVADAELADAVHRADSTLAGFLELCYFTGQRPGDVVKMRRQDVHDGALHVQQAKTDQKVRIDITGPLESVIARLTAGAVGSMFLVRDARGQPLTLAAIRKRFLKLGTDWQIRDLRAKAASDSKDAKAAQSLLGHAAASTTDGYIRQRIGQRASPVMRVIADEPGGIADSLRRNNPK